jgi:3-oxoacyl-[acyl-carrier protein] reductase
MIDLTGKKVLVTGGSRGIGCATSILFAEAGCDVAINYAHKEGPAKSVKAQIEHLGRNCLILKADVSKINDVERMVRQIYEKWTGIDIVVNNAGIWTYGEMGNMDESTWKETMGINLDGVFYVCNAVVPEMKAGNGGVIIIVSSTAGIRGEAFHSHYAASKGALISFTKSLAQELAPYRIRVNCVTPGWVDTDMCVDILSDSAFRKDVEESIPLKRISDPVDIAGPILFLASDLARHITGEILNVNGGSVLCG